MPSIKAPARPVYFKVGRSGKGLKAKEETRLARRLRGQFSGLSCKGGGCKEVFKRFQIRWWHLEFRILVHNPNKSFNLNLFKQKILVPRTRKFSELLFALILTPIMIQLVTGML